MLNSKLNISEFWTDGQLKCTFGVGKLRAFFTVFWRLLTNWETGKTIGRIINNKNRGLWHYHPLKFYFKQERRRIWTFKGRDNMVCLRLRTVLFLSRCQSRLQSATLCKILLKSCYKRSSLQFMTDLCWQPCGKSADWSAEVTVSGSKHCQRQLGTSTKRKTEI